MIELRQINSGEQGISVRAKLNTLFRDIISGKEGINSIQDALRSFSSEVKTLSGVTEEKYEELREQVLKSFDYTDVSVADLLVYINGMNGGVSGFAVDTTFNPDFPLNKPVTVLAGQKGTYTHFLDQNGNPITITQEGVTIFYRGANSTYWKYKTIPVEVNVQKELLNAITSLESIGALVWSDYLPIVRDGKAYQSRISALPKAFRENTMPGNVIEDASITEEKLSTTLKEIISKQRINYPSGNALLHLQKMGEHNWAILSGDAQSTQDFGFFQIVLGHDFTNLCYRTGARAIGITYDPSYASMPTGITRYFINPNSDDDLPFDTVNGKHVGQDQYIMRNVAGNIVQKIDKDGKLHINYPSGNELLGSISIEGKTYGALYGDGTDGVPQIIFESEATHLCYNGNGESAITVNGKHVGQDQYIMRNVAGRIVQKIDQEGRLQLYYPSGNPLLQQFSDGSVNYVALCGDSDSVLSVAVTPDMTALFYTNGTSAISVAYDSSDPEIPTGTTRYFINPNGDSNIPFDTVNGKHVGQDQYIMRNVAGRIVQKIDKNGELIIAKFSGKKVVFIGDSMMTGYPASTYNEDGDSAAAKQNGYPFIFAKRQNANVKLIALPNGILRTANCNGVPCEQVDRVFMHTFSEATNATQGLDADSKNRALKFSYESLFADTLGEYKESDLYVIGFGGNEISVDADPITNELYSNSEFNENSDVPIDTLDTKYYTGAINKLIKYIYDNNSNAKVCIVSRFSYDDAQNKNNFNALIIERQKKICKFWNIPLILPAEVLGWCYKKNLGINIIGKYSSVSKDMAAGEGHMRHALNP